jgi:hypothetical protein
MQCASHSTQFGVCESGDEELRVVALMAGVTVEVF